MKNNDCTSQAECNLCRIALNRKYRLDNFAARESNLLAQAAARAVAELQTSTPLFVYGSTGLGKTHLLQGIGNHVQQGNHAARICYCTGETFMHALIESFRSKALNDFRRTFREIDLLLFDNAQFLSGKAATQEEFLQLFDLMRLADKPIVMAADRHPKAIKHLGRKLRSRITGGLIVEITQPDAVERAAILTYKATEYGLNLSDEVITFVSEIDFSDTRELEALLLRHAALQNLAGKEQNIPS